MVYNLKYINYKLTNYIQMNSYVDNHEKKIKHSTLIKFYFLLLQEDNLKKCSIYLISKVQEIVSSSNLP